MAAPEKDPHGRDPHKPGAKLDHGKNRVWLCVSGFANALNEVANVTTKGAEKYTPNGWKEVPNGVERYMDAVGRHLLALGSGEVFDKDTGCRHKAQAIWGLLASLELELRDGQQQVPGTGEAIYSVADLVAMKPETVSQRPCCPKEELTRPLPPGAFTGSYAGYPWGDTR
jgi:hypothetical protein